MKKEKQEIAVNTSSGAEKVETIEKEIKKTGANSTAKKTVKAVKETAKGEAALGSEKEKVNAKKMNAQSTSGKAEKESKAAKARVQAAMKKQEEKAKKKAAKAERAAKRKAEREKRIAEIRAQIEKRAAEHKEKIAKRAAERNALAEKRKAEKEEKLRARAHAKANKKRENARKNANRQKRVPQRKNRDERKGNGNKGYGGWIAAVVSLGVVTLALATTVTVGAIEMNNATNAAVAAYRGTMYELTGVMENVDKDLDRARISSTPTQQSRILTDLLVQARLAEMDLEKLPLSAEGERNLTIFVNRTAKECERMLSKIAAGEELSQSDYQTLEKLYQTNRTIRQELDKLMSETCDKDFMCFMKKGQGKVADAMQRVEKATMEENRLTSSTMEEKAELASGKSNMPAQPKEKAQSKIDCRRAEELCKQYFKKYNIEEYQCVGETVSQSFVAYNVQGYDDKGTMLFAEISQNDGALLRFEYYEECSAETFDLQNAERIAEEFLEGLGYDDMEIVRFRQNGTTTDFTFVYEDDDVLYYPDEVRVKVCRSRGVVTGFDAGRYLTNHKNRDEAMVKLNLAQAREKLHKALSVEASKLAVVQTVRGERPAYEFLCSYGEDNYFVYIDGVTGQEIAIVNTKDVG